MSELSDLSVYAVRLGMTGLTGLSEISTLSTWQVGPRFRYNPLNDAQSWIFNISSEASDPGTEHDRLWMFGLRIVNIYIIARCSVMSK